MNPSAASHVSNGLWGSMSHRWSEWWATVPPEFAFLLALPFVVAAIGLGADTIRGRKRH